MYIENQWTTLSDTRTTCNATSANVETNSPVTRIFILAMQSTGDSSRENIHFDALRMNTGLILENQTDEVMKIKPAKPFSSLVHWFSAAINITSTTAKFIHDIRQLTQFRRPMRYVRTYVYNVGWVQFMSSRCTIYIEYSPYLQRRTGTRHIFPANGGGVVSVRHLSAEESFHLILKMWQNVR